MRKIVWLFALLLSLGLTSCIDIIDEINLNADKSGTVFIGLESKMLASIMGMAEEQIDTSTINQFMSFPKESADRLKNIKGVHEINAFDIISKGRIGIGFSFDNPKALNKAYYALLEMEKAWYQPNIVKIRKHKIIRMNLTPQLVKQIEKENPKLKDSEFVKYLNIKTILKLPNNIKEVECADDLRVIDNKEVAMRYSFLEVLKEKKSTAYKIRF